MLNNPYQELNNQYHYVSQTAIQSISKRSLLSIPRRTSCSSHLWPTCREHGLLSSKHWSAVLPQNSTLVMSFLFQHLDLTRILGQKPSSLAQFCKEGKEFLVSNGESQEKPLWVPGWDGEAQHLAVVVNCGKPGKPRGWEPAGTIPEHSKVLTYLDMYVLRYIWYMVVSQSRPLSENPANDRDELSRGKFSLNLFTLQLFGIFFGILWFSQRLSFPAATTTNWPYCQNLPSST